MAKGCPNCGIGTDELSPEDIPKYAVAKIDRSDIVVDPDDTSYYGVAKCPDCGVWIRSGDTFDSVKEYRKYENGRSHEVDSISTFTDLESAKKAVKSPTANREGQLFWYHFG